MLVNNAGKSTGHDIESFIECRWQYFELVMWSFFYYVQVCWDKVFNQVKFVEDSL